MRQRAPTSLTEIPITEARSSLGMLANRAGIRGEHILLMRNGRPLAAIVPFEDAEYMQAKEDELDGQAARQAMSEGKFVPWEGPGKERVPHRDCRAGAKAARRSA